MARANRPKLKTTTIAQAIYRQLEKASREYQEAKARLDDSRIQFEAVSEQLAAVKKLASQILTPQEWHAWLGQTSEGEAIMYAGMPVGDAILEVLRKRVYDQADDFINGRTERFRPAMSLSEITRVLEGGGFEFNSSTPRREVNAALMQLAGVKKTMSGYQLDEADEAFRYAKNLMETNEPGKETKP